VTNQHLKELPLCAAEYLRNIFNACLRIGYFPKQWKVSIIRCLCKPGKLTTLVDSYRPISLLTCISKIFERVILEEINRFTSDNEVIKPHQFGFRPGKSCTHQLYRITRHVKSLITRKKSVGMLSIDLKAAFDSVWHAGILHKMQELQFPIYLIKVIKS